jgi:hypothetical protein
MHKEYYCQSSINSIDIYSIVQEEGHTCTHSKHQIWAGVGAYFIIRGGHNNHAAAADDGIMV